MAINDPYDWWKMDESPSASSAVNSGSNSSYPLDNIAGNTDFTTSGLINNGVEITGASSDRMYATGNWDIGSNDFSVGCFFKADDYGVADGRLITQSSGVSANSHEFMLSTNNTLTVRARMRIDGSVETLVGSDNIVTLGKWHHVCATYSSSAGDLLLYLDAVEVGSDTTLSGNFGVGTPTRDVGVGNTPSGTSRAFDGIIDDIRTFSRALTAADVEEWYRLGLGGEELLDGETVVTAGGTATELLDGLSAVAASELLDGKTVVPGAVVLLDGKTAVAVTELVDGNTAVAVIDLLDGTTTVAGQDSTVLLDGVNVVAASEALDGLSRVAVSELVDGLSKIAVSELLDGETTVTSGGQATTLLDGLTSVALSALLDGNTSVAVTELLDGNTAVATLELVDGLTLVAVVELVDGRTVVPGDAIELLDGNTLVSSMSILHNIAVGSDTTKSGSSTSGAVSGVTIDSKV